MMGETKNNEALLRDTLLEKMGTPRSELAELLESVAHNLIQQAEQLRGTPKDVATASTRDIQEAILKALRDTNGGDTSGA